jgi:hypothetical protein
MVQTIQSRDVTLRELRTNFGLQLTHDPQFFPEWQGNLPEITELQQQQLDQVKAGYFNLLNYPPMLEGVVRMAILDPLLFIYALPTSFLNIVRSRHDLTNLRAMV